MVLKVLIISELDIESGSMRAGSVERFKSFVKEILEMAVRFPVSTSNSITFLAVLYLEVVYARVRAFLETLA